jgi:hypothetical protein
MMRQDEVMSHVLFSMRHFNVEDTVFWLSKCLMANSMAMYKARPTL